MSTTGRLVNQTCCKQYKCYHRKQSQVQKGEDEEQALLISSLSQGRNLSHSTWTCFQNQLPDT